jgi:MshEN domain
MSMVDVPLGTLIFRAGLLGEEQLEDALQEGMRTGKRLGEVLLERGWLNERDLGLMLAGQKGLPFVDVSVSDVEPEALDALAEEDARRQVALPLFYEDGELVIAVGDPSNEVVLEGLRRAVETDFQLVVAPHSQLQRVIEEAYSRPAHAPAPQLEGVLFPDLVPPARNGGPVDVQSEPSFEPEPETDAEAVPEAEAEAQPESTPDLGFAPALETEPEPGAEGEDKPFSGSTPTLLSRMLFPSVRHAAQEAEVAVERTAEEPVAEAPAPEEAAEPAEAPAPELAEATAPEPAEAPAPEPAEASAPAEEDFAEFEVPAIPEMPIPSFEQPAEAKPAAPEEAPEPAGEQPVEAEPAAPEEAPEPAGEQPAEDAQSSTHFVLVRLRDGDSLRIGEHGSAAEASAQAADAVAQISAAASNGTWPLFAGRYLSPDTIVSVDLLEESPDA